MNPNHQQGSPEWLSMRRNYIGASDANILMGVSKYGKTPRDLWEEKLCLFERVELNIAAMEYGKINEPIARKLYEEISGILVVPDVVFHKELNFMMASLDGISMDRDIAVEIKCTNRLNHEMSSRGIVPEEFFPQLQHQMACLGHDVIHYFSYNKSNGIIIEVKRDEDYLERLYKTEKHFWNCVENYEFKELDPNQ